ncbi:hypothetical protein DFH11DRAFT_1723020 [Phellopilus nigrolimitatus]|nr:hypothetical protein DFH11DRAFT_1723020 [Phellopilus nigrolimitatus]
MTDPSNASNSLQPVVFFDRAIYTLNTVEAQSNQPSSSGESSAPTRIPVSGEVAHSSNIGPLVGGVVGGIAFIGLVVSTLFVFIRRRARQRVASQRVHVEPLDVINQNGPTHPERKRPLPMISQLPGQRSLFVTEKALSRAIAAQAQAFPPEEHHPVLPTVQPTVAITPSRTDQGADRTSLAELRRPSAAPEETSSLSMLNGNEGEISQNDRERIARLEAEMEYLRAEREVRPGEDLPAYDNLVVGQRVD